MGLFRRGTRLLRLGSGLRDCCCPADACWCPDLCSYYFIADGNSSIEASGCERSLLYTELENCASVGDQAVCTGLLGITLNPSVKQHWYYFGPGSAIGLPEGFLGVYKRIGFEGLVSSTPVPPVGFVPQPDDFERVRFACDIRAGIKCDLSVSGSPVWHFICLYNSSVEKFVQERTPAPFPATGARFTNIETTQLSRLGQLSGEPTEASSIDEEAYDGCNSDNLRTCVLSGVSVNHLSDLVAAVSPSGVTISGDGFSQFFPWESSQNQTICTIFDQSVSGTPIEVPCLSPEPLGLPEDESLYTMQVQILKQPSCQPGEPCDCTASMVGRRVLFEGREFTVGELDTILGTSIEHDGLSYWEEVSAGSFRRTDYETCGDGSYVRRVKQATVACADFGDDVDRWYVILDHICYDRDPDSCESGFTASRERTWTGYFSCTQAGKPLGMPKGENGLGDPELIFDFTSGTLEFSCLGEQGCCGFGDSGIPFISFPNPFF